MSAESGSRAVPGAMIVVLERLVRAALGSEGIDALIVRDGRRYQVVLSQRAGCVGGHLDAGAHAVFSFEESRVEGLMQLGVGVPELAESAFAGLLDQLAAHATDKTGFMRAVHRRLERELEDVAAGSPR